MLRNVSLYWENTLRTRCGISKIVHLDIWNVKKTLAMKLSCFEQGKRTLAPLLCRQNPRFKTSKACQTWFSMERKEQERVRHIPMLLFVCLSFLLSLFVSWCLCVFLSDFFCLSLSVCLSVCLSVSDCLYVSVCLCLYLSLSLKRRSLTGTWIRIIQSRGHWLISANLTKTIPSQACHKQMRR